MRHSPRGCAAASAPGPLALALAAAVQEARQGTAPTARPTLPITYRAHCRSHSRQLGLPTCSACPFNRARRCRSCSRWWSSSSPWLTRTCACASRGCAGVAGAAAAWPQCARSVPRGLGAPHKGAAPPSTGVGAHSPARCRQPRPPAHASGHPLACLLAVDADAAGREQGGHPAPLVPPAGPAPTALPRPSAPHAAARRRA